VIHLNSTMEPDFIDIHTHTTRDTNRYVINIFAQELTENFAPQNPCTIGLHPWHLLEQDCEDALQKIIRWANHPMVIGIGECGLDKKIDIPLQFQEEQFIRQLIIAEEIRKPAIIHCVKAYSELLRIRKNKKWEMPWMIHWFNTSREIAQELIQSGCYLSFGRSLVHPDGKNASVFYHVPLESVFFETDDAEITIQKVYTRAGEIKQIELTVLVAQIENNYNRFFGHG
jgi:TatD DNase family protein